MVADRRITRKRKENERQQERRKTEKERRKGKEKDVKLTSYFVLFGMIFILIVQLKDIKMRSKTTKLWLIIRSYFLNKKIFSILSII